MKPARKALPVDTDAEIKQLLVMMPPFNLDQIKSMLARRFRLKYHEVERLPGKLKAIVRVRKFIFARHVPAASRTFMVLHCLGHYHLICGASGGPCAHLSPDAGANDFAIALLAHDRMANAPEMLRRYEIGDMGHILGVLRGGGNPRSRQSLYDPMALAPDGIDWAFIEQFQPEIHFF